MWLPRRLLLFFSSWVLLACRSVVHADDSAKADPVCLEILDFASTAQESRERSLRGGTVLNACKRWSSLHQGRVPLVQAQGGGNASDLDTACHEFAHLYVLAHHYERKGGSFSKEDFCVAAEVGPEEDGETDSKLDEHNNCVAGLAVVLSSFSNSIDTHLNQDAVAACKAARSGRLAEDKAEMNCQRYVAALSHVSEAGLLDPGQVCDKLVDNGHRGNASAEEYSVFSCMRYADSLVANTTEKSPMPAATAQRKCTADFAAFGLTIQVDFCPGFAKLISRRAPRQEFLSYCKATGESKRVAKQPHLDMRSADQGLVGKSKMEFHVRDHGANREQVNGSNENAHRGGTGLLAACEKIVEAAMQTHLKGVALEHAAAEGCQRELLSDDTKPKLQVRVGCRHLARQLATSASFGSIANFCAALTGHKNAGMMPKATAVPGPQAGGHEAPHNDNRQSKIDLKTSHERRENLRRKVFELFGDAAAKPQPSKSAPLSDRSDTGTANGSVLVRAGPRAGGTSVKTSFLDATGAALKRPVSHSAVPDVHYSASGDDSANVIDALVTSFVAEQEQSLN